jgi:hypothetical protein
MAILGNDDLQAIKGLIKVTIDEAIDEKLVTRDDIGLLPTKDEFFTKMDEVMGGTEKRKGGTDFTKSASLRPRRQN